MTRANELAYPVEHECYPTSGGGYALRDKQTGESRYLARGLTLREHFAGLAMQALAPGNGPRFDAPFVAQLAVEYADALLAELEKAR